MKILAIDPGSKESAWLIYDENRQRPINFDISENEAFLMDIIGDEIVGLPATFTCIEMIASYGMPVGKDVFETCIWIGRFIQAVDSTYLESTETVYRKDVKLHLCHNMRAKDPNIRQALIDRFGPGREKAIGTKKNPGPLYGIKRDLWSALALAVTYADRIAAEGGGDG